MKDKLVRNFVVGTFVSLYLLVSVISTIHVIDFFELSNPYWLAVTLAIGFEVGAAASLASLVILDKMNKTLVWALFITITLMQMQGNMYYAFINMEDYTSWSELFALIEEEPLFQKRVLAAISGAILPLVALGFIKSLVDYIKPEEDKEETLTEGILDDTLMDEFETKPSEEYFEDIETYVTNQGPNANAMDVTINTDVANQWNALADQLAATEDWDITLQDGLEDEEWDEDHALDQVMNDMVSDMTEEEIQSLIDETVPEPFATPEELTEEPVRNTDMLEILEQEIDTDESNGNDDEDEEINPTSVGSVIKEKGLIDDEKLWNEAMAKKAKEDMDLFIKNKDGNNKA